MKWRFRSRLLAIRLRISFWRSLLILMFYVLTQWNRLKRSNSKNSNTTKRSQVNQNKFPLETMTVIFLIMSLQTNRKKK